MYAGSSYEEFLEQYDGQHVEWVAGKACSLGPVTDRHQAVGGWLLTLLRTYSEERRPGVVLTRPFQMRTGPNVPGRSPDILFVAAANDARLKKTYLDGPADLVIEIISPESRARDRGDKFYEYEQGGVPEYWLLDPVREQAEFYQLGADGIYRPVIPDAQNRYHSAVLPGLWLQVDWLWETPLPPLLDVLKAWALI